MQQVFDVVKEEEKKDDSLMIREYKGNNIVNGICFNFKSQVEKCKSFLIRMEYIKCEYVDILELYILIHYICRYTS